MGVLGVVGGIMLGFAVAACWVGVVWCWFRRCCHRCGGCPLSRAVSSLRIDMSWLKRWSGRHVSRASEVTETQI